MKISMTSETPSFTAFNNQVMANIEKAGPLFTTDIDLWDIYQRSFDSDAMRQEHNCNCCKSFIRRFGSLVTVDEYGVTRSALWDPSKDYGYFNQIVSNMALALAGAKITGVFLTKESVMGVGIQGGWDHFWVRTPLSSVATNPILTANQLMAEKREDFRILNIALAKYSEDTVATALQLLNSDAMFRSEKVIGNAQWFNAVHQAIKGVRRQNKIWVMVATAPAGFCHVSSNVIGSLLDDIAAGMQYDTLAARFTAKMNPLQYQRPQAAASAGNVARAEAIFKEMGLERSLARRSAVLADLKLEWTPRPAAPAAAQGIFGHVLDTPKTGYEVPAVRITYDKFARTVLPNAESIEYLAPARGNYSALLTAVHEDAPNLLQWNNTVNWYVYSGGSTSASWNLTSGTWYPVEGITLQPSMWEGDFKHQGESVFFLIKGCRDSRKPSLALFPEVLRSELREVRSTIEAFSRKGTPLVATKPACGVKFKNEAIRVRVKSGDVVTPYIIDRMD